MKEKKRLPDRSNQFRARGRPSMPDGAARIITLSLKVSQDELDVWGKLAEAKGMTIREYILAPHRQGKKRKGIS